MQVREPVQANVRGVALLASASLGYMTFDEIPSHVAIAKTFAPNTANRALYDELFREFVKLYHANKEIYARLNRAQH